MSSEAATDTPSRSDQLDQQFLEQPPVIAGRTVKPFTAGILTAARKAKLVMFTGTEEQKKALSTEEKQYELMALLFFLTHDAGEILSALAGGNLREKVEAFEFDLPIQDLSKVNDVLESVVQRAEVAGVEVVEKPSDKEDEKNAPPNA